MRWLYVAAILACWCGFGLAITVFHSPAAALTCLSMAVWISVDGMEALFHDSPD